jgi:hypothetical protein
MKASYYCQDQGDALMTSADALRDSFRHIGRMYGYEEVEATFAPFKEFKSTWRRSGKQAVFQVSDYLEGAEGVVLEDFAHSLFSRIARRGAGELYTDRLRSWLQSPEFLVKNQPLYLERSRNLSMTPKGGVYDLKDTYRRLRERGLISGSEDAVLNWTVKGNRLRVGYCSVLMRVVAVSSLLDSVEVPDHVHEYVLYHELLHLENGLTSGRRHHDQGFRRKERLYPMWRESEEWLKRLASRRSG